MTDPTPAEALKAGRLIDRVSDEILRTMNAVGISQRELAQRLGVTEERVCQMLNRANLTLRTVDRIFSALRSPIPMERLTK